MKKLKLNLEGKEMLTKDQMKKITGGYEFCIFYYSASCGGGSSNQAMPCTSDCACQDIADEICLANNCCDDANCGCK